MISGGAPAADATIVRHGLRRFLWMLLFAPVTLVSGGLGVNELMYGGGGSFTRWIAMAFLLMALLFAIPVVSGWRARRWVTAFDATGFWWIRGKKIALIRWDSLAGVGIYYTHQTFTVELCPRDEIDRDDPLLWQFVRDTEPLRPGLPRVRYRIRLPHSFKPYEKALRRWAPELWFGLVAQPLSYMGRPDVAGHRERTAGRRGEG
ncbi:hypothetical protein [Streptomyces ossamyceticus]|jgi:hypothetical protein|uniref:hypothetical protein n=1 Tax=Streptomyces ossamyceticus TaxID=249581 RepID=UPI0006E3BD30|nr:hypothetical protein [Streptomyces ossamyceticus]